MPALLHDLELGTALSGERRDETRTKAVGTEDCVLADRQAGLSNDQVHGALAEPTAERSPLPDAPEERTGLPIEIAEPLPDGSGRAYVEMTTCLRHVEQRAAAFLVRLNVLARSASLADRRARREV